MLLLGHSAGDCVRWRIREYEVYRHGHPPIQRLRDSASYCISRDACDQGSVLNMGMGWTGHSSVRAIPHISLAVPLDELR